MVEDRRLKVTEIAEITRMSAERVCNILRERLCMEKLCAWWVLHLLTVDQKLIRKTVFNKNLTRCKLNPSKFLGQFIIADETWIHHYIPESGR